VKDNLEDHLRKVNGLPSSQYGFRPKRSCTSALAHAQAGWLSGAAKGKVVGLMALTQALRLTPWRPNSWSQRYMP
jgi:hypothetical protein